MKRLLFALFASLALLVVSLPAAPPYYPIDQVKPGMVATGHTVWQGDTVEEFKVHILGVLHNVIGPKRDLILARLEGGPLAQTGVIAGMSGSPVYIDGQARRRGVVFARRVFQGADRRHHADRRDDRRGHARHARVRRSARARDSKCQSRRESVAAALRASMSWARPFADRPGDVQILRRRRQRPGRDDDAADRHAAESSAASRPRWPNCSARRSATTGSCRLPALRPLRQMPAEPTIAASAWRSAVGVNIVSGDFNMGATGTVTEVIGNRSTRSAIRSSIWGRSQFPMTQAYVHALLPSMTSSMKIATTGDVIGTVQQDRATTIAGLMGDGAGDDSGEDLARIRARLQEGVRSSGS